MAAPDTLTISAAARLCRVDRRTLQRAIHAGRLHLDAAHCLDREELLAAGYLVRPPPQDAPQDAPQVTPQPPELFLLLGRLTLALEGLWHEVRQLRAELRQMPHAAPQEPPQATPQQAPQEPPQGEDCPPFDATKNRLGRLCPRGHEWGNTGQSLLRLPIRRCRQCENQLRRERRAASG